ncbi:MAG TPA: hypothetical protein VLL25_02295, partial [Acidimicrobiales bacterium]|nr:hypothetical protein [Acidimicrobiales bacterium]
MTDLERVTPASVEAAVKLWSDSSFLPAHYRNPDGSVKEGDLRIACARLDGLGLDPRLNLDGVFVVGGKPHLMADIQRAL